MSVQDDDHERLQQNAARCVLHVSRLDPIQGYGVRGLHTVPSELSAGFDRLVKDPAWKYVCRRCSAEKPTVSLLRGDGSQMFKEINHPRVRTAFDNSARRVRQVWNTDTVYESFVRGERQPPEIAKSFFTKNSCISWTFGRPEGSQVPPHMALRGRDGRCLEHVLEATAEKNVSR